jgi:hypothetical protein
MDQDQREELHAMSPEEQQAAMGLPTEPEAEPGTGPTGGEADLPDLSPNQQLAAMGLVSQTEADPSTGATGQEADLPDLPPNQQLKAMGVTPEPEAEQAAGATGLVEPELEAYAAQRAKQGATDANGCC